MKTKRTIIIKLVFLDVWVLDLGSGPIGFGSKLLKQILEYKAPFIKMGICPVIGGNVEFPRFWPKGCWKRAGFVALAFQSPLEKAPGGGRVRTSRMSPCLS